MDLKTRIHKLVDSFEVVKFVHNGQDVIEIKQGSKVHRTYVQASPATIFCYPGKAEGIHKRGLKGHSTSWSRDPQSIETEALRAVKKLIAQQIEDLV